MPPSVPHPARQTPPVPEDRRYPEAMTTSPEHQSAGGTDALLAAAGIVVTEEGKQRAKQRRLAIEAEWTPERWDALHAQLRGKAHAA